jgi:hypothetical protein
MIITSVAVSASDLVGGVSNLMMGSVVSTATPCGEDAVLERFGSHALCVDRYEAAANPVCPFPDPRSELETEANILARSCTPESRHGALGWRFVTQNQAAQLCARVDKRLPTAAEWHRIALTLQTVDTCVLNADRPQVAGATQCVTPSGVHDLVGNVWEWIGDTVSEGRFNGRAIPQAGYVAVVDDAGVVVKTSEAPSLSLGSDYAWTDQQGVRGIMKGGFYGSGEDGGIYAQNMAVPLDFQAAGVGFRCVSDVE